MLSRREFIKSGVAGLLAILLPKPIVRFAEKYLPIKTVSVCPECSGYSARTSDNEITTGFFESFPNCPMEIYIIDRDCGELPEPDEDGALVNGIISTHLLSESVT